MLAFNAKWLENTKVFTLSGPTKIWLEISFIEEKALSKEIDSAFSLSTYAGKC